MTIRVLIAEDQAMVRGALSALLTLEDDFEIVAEISRGDEVVPAALDSLPDVALLDIEMPGGDELTAAAALRGSPDACGSPAVSRQTLASRTSKHPALCPR